MQMTATRVNKKRQISVEIRSTISIVKKLETFAIQKKKPLMISDFIPSFYISMKARDTKELKPARSTIMIKIRK